MSFDRFICPECGSTRLKMSSATPTCYYCALCAYVVRDHSGQPIASEEGLKAWVLGTQASLADVQRLPGHETPSFAPPVGASPTPQRQRTYAAR